MSQTVFEIGYKDGYESAQPRNALCIVKGCPSMRSHGGFVGEICAVCRKMITQGVVPSGGETFIHDLEADAVTGKRVIRELQLKIDALRNAATEKIAGIDLIDADTLPVRWRRVTAGYVLALERAHRLAKEALLNVPRCETK